MYSKFLQSRNYILPLSTPLYSLLALFLYVSATPLSSPREADITYEMTPVTNIDLGPSSDSPDSQVLAFSASGSTCGLDLPQPVGLTKTPVKAQPDCDTVINKICTAIESMASMIQNQSFHSLNYMSGTCQGYILFPTTTTVPLEPIDYTTCAQGFQSITTTCIPQDSAGLQAGVTNVDFTSSQSSKYPSFWTVPNNTNAPGYMIGATSYFENAANVYNASDVQPDGQLVKATQQTSL